MAHQTPYEHYLSALRLDDTVKLSGIAFGENKFTGRIVSISPIRIEFSDPRFPHDGLRTLLIENLYPWALNAPAWLWEAGGTERLRTMSKRPHHHDARDEP